MKFANFMALTTSMRPSSERTTSRQMNHTEVILDVSGIADRPLSYVWNKYYTVLTRNVRPSFGLQTQQDLLADARCRCAQITSSQARRQGSPNSSHANASDLYYTATKSKLRSSVRSQEDIRDRHFA